MLTLSARKPIICLTGDLGFMALEPLQQAMGPRFINAGVAEQNMIGVAAGLASGGEQCWAYSIAPFLYSRAHEQIRNDVCLHDCDVKLVGNGGGFGYGVMGPTHHAIEDYGVLSGLQHMRVHVPAFAADIRPIVDRMSADPHPAYLRLGRCEQPKGWLLPEYAPWRRLLDGEAGILIVIGPGVGGLLERAAEMPVSARPEIWLATELPFDDEVLPPLLLERIRETGRLFILEEHVAHGGAGQMMACLLLSHGIAPKHFVHFHAKGYASGRYGSQSFHRIENGIDPASVIAAIGGISAG